MKKDAIVQVEVLKLAGETGLRLPGTLFTVQYSIAEKWAKRGIVVIKEQKTPIFTKEEKFKANKPQTKRSQKAKQ